MNIKRIIAFCLAFVLVLNIVINQNYFLQVFAQNAASTEEVVVENKNSDTEKISEETTTSECSEETTISTTETTTESSEEKSTQTTEETTPATESTSSAVKENTEHVTETEVGTETLNQPESNKKTEQFTDKEKKDQSKVDEEQKTVLNEKTVEKSKQEKKQSIVSDDKKNESVKTNIKLVEEADYSVNNSEQKITFKTSTKNQFNQYKINSEDWKNIEEDKPSTEALTDGIYTIQMRCTDSNGTPTSISESKKIIIDTKAPKIEKINVGDEWKNSEYKLVIPVSDEVSGVSVVNWQCWNKDDWNQEENAPKDGVNAKKTGSIRETGNQFVLTSNNIIDGSYIYCFYAEDEMENKTQDAAVVTINKDSTKLENKLTVSDYETEVSGNEWNAENSVFYVTVNVPDNANNPSGINKVIARYSKNGEEKEILLDKKKEETSKEIYVFVPKEGDNTYTIQAISGSGELGKDNIVRIKYDNKAPSSNILASYYLVKDGKETILENNDNIQETDQIKIRLYVHDEFSGMDDTVLASYISDPDTQEKEVISFKKSGIVSVDNESSEYDTYYEFIADQAISGKIFINNQSPLKIDELKDMAGNRATDNITIAGFSGNVTKITDNTPPEFSVEGNVMSQKKVIYTKDTFTPTFNIFEEDSFSSMKEGETIVDYSYNVSGGQNISQNLNVNNDNAPAYMFTGESLNGVDGEETRYTISFAYKDGSGNSMILSKDLVTLPYGSLSNGVFSAEVVVDKKAPVVKKVTVDNYNVDSYEESKKYYALYDKKKDLSYVKVAFDLEESNLDLASVTIKAQSSEGKEIEIGTVEDEEGRKLDYNYNENENNYTFSFNLAEEGEWSFEVIAKDIVGNVVNQYLQDSNGQQINAIIDSSVPEISVQYDMDLYPEENTIYTNKGKTGSEYTTVVVTVKDEQGINDSQNNPDISWMGTPVKSESIVSDDKKSYKLTYQLKIEDKYQITGFTYTSRNGAIPQNIKEIYPSGENSRTIGYGEFNSGKAANIIVDYTDPEINDVTLYAESNIFYNDNLYLNINKNKSSLSFNIYETNLIKDGVSINARSYSNNIVSLTNINKLGSSGESNTEFNCSFGIDSWENVSEGYYQISVNAKDKAGNTTEGCLITEVKQNSGSVESLDNDTNTNQYQIVYDKTQPELEINYPKISNKVSFGEEAWEIFYQSRPDIEINLSDQNLVKNEDGNVLMMVKDGETASFAPLLSTNANDDSDKHDEKFIFEDVNANQIKAEVPFVQNDLNQPDSHNRFSLCFTDLSGNKANITEKSDEGLMKYGKEESQVYYSPEITIDTIKPVINVSFSGTEKSDSYQKRTGNSGRTYFSSDVEMIITVTEENFNPEDFKFDGNIKKYEETGEEELNPKTWIKDKYYENGKFLKPDKDEKLTDDIHQFVIKLTDEWNYDLKFDYTDLATWGADTQSHKISVDKTKPSIEVRNIENLSDSDMEFFNGAIGNDTLDFYDYIKYGYFGKKKVAVRIEAHDDTSGVQYVEVKINGQVSIHELKDGSANGSLKDIVHDKEGTWYTVIFLDADFKGTIEARPVDKAGNLQNNYASPRGVVSETQSKHDSSSILKIDTLTQPSNVVDGVNYYNRDVNVKLLMEDDHSGIKSYSYIAGTEITGSHDYGDEAGTVDKNGEPSVDNIYKKEFTPSLTATANYTNKQNPTVVEAEFTDNAGYTEKAREEYVIDDKKPVIEVTWTSDAEVMNEKYYKSTRVAHIKVTERNFDENGVEWDFNNKTGVHISDWNHNGDDNTCTVSFTKDGDFLMNFSITDYAKNTSKWKGEEFTIDKTAPVISISFDNMDAENGNYYNKARTATLHVEEHNFRADDVKYELSATNDGKGIASPTAGGWSMGSDHHTASIYYGTDGNFSLNFNYTDMAGNPANVIATEEFVVDLTKPTVKIINVEDHNAYNGKVAPGVEYSDTNLDENEVVIRLVGNKVGNADYERNAPSTIHNGKVIEWKDFERISEVDDIYTFEVVVKDKAGNVNDPAKVTFSVNRFGSNYIFGDQTEELLSKEYPYTNTEIPIEVTEINVNTLKQKAVSVRNEDNDIENLTENVDYSVTEGLDKYKWNEYKYVINAENFVEEGEYTVTLFSEDMATNQMDNVTKDKDIKFVIDKTVPTGTISGLEKDSYREDEHEIVVRAGDNYGLDKAILYVDDEIKGEYGAQDFVADAGVSVILTSKNTPQNVSMDLYDLAGNSTRIGHGENEKGCLITSNAWIQFYNNKPLFISVMGVGIVGILAVIGVLTHGFGFVSSMAAETGFWWFLFGKRKKDEGEKNN